MLLVLLWAIVAAREREDQRIVLKPGLVIHSIYNGY
jgi:hypothetical protein